MRDGKIGRRGTINAALTLCAMALWLAALAPSAFAAPNHPRAAALDVEGLDHACGAAVDSEGNVYASSAGEGKVKVFDSADHDTPIAEIANANEPCALAVNSKGVLLVSEQGTGNVVAYGPDAYPLSGTPTYSPATTIDASGDAEGIAIDRTDDRLYVAEGDHVSVYNSESQQVSVFDATGGTYKLKFEGQETASLPFNATATEVQAALEALSTIGAGEISVSSGKRVTFTGALAYTDVPQLELVSSLQGNESQKVTVKATTGTFKLKFEGEETGTIAFNATAATVKAALEALANVAPGDVAVVGGPGDATGTKPYLFTFAGAYAATNVGTMTSVAGGLGGGTAAVASASQFQTIAVAATAGTYKLKFPNVGGEETGPIDFDATAAELQAALEALGNIAPGDVSVSGGPGDAGGTKPYLVHFEGAYAASDIGQMGKDVSALTGTATVSRILSGASHGTTTPTSGGIGVGETQEVKVTNALSGTFKLKFAGQETASIPFNATAAALQAALEALANVAPGDVAVFPNGAPTFASRGYSVGFGGAYAATDVSQLEAVSSLGPGGAGATVSTTGTGWSGRALEGQISEATGVAAYTNASAQANPRLNLAVADGAGDEVEIFSGAGPTTLKSRRTITGTDHDEDPGTAEQEFSFGAAGAYLAVDPGNEDAPIQGCIQVAEQACTQGHFFLHDAGNDAIYEFDASGEFFTQIANPALEDAEPTQVAVERSGGPSDGTLYAGSGSGAGAALLAFGPVLEPSRPQLEEPFSKVLSGAVAVAVDCEGYVYVAAQVSVRVYSPTGAEVTSFAEANVPSDLAVDCAGNVYVVDTTGTPQMTYYSPSSYPPSGSTTYARHEPSLLAAPGLVGVAVNPANDHVFVLGNSDFSPIIREFGPPSGGSKAEGECGVGLGLENARRDIDVYGKNGNVYVSSNPERVYVLKCGKEAKDAELIREVKGGGGCPNGDWDGNPEIAVDQSNGHFIEWANNQTGGTAREHDAIGACLAEFGTFSSFSGEYQLAIDGSCALHELTEQTTPTCADAYPSNGNAYVAFDSPNNGVQPFDVNAFGPLGYGKAPEEPEEFTLKVNKAGSGTGTVTSSPSGISCGSTCEADFEEGTEVTLTGSPGANSKAVVWTGCDSVNGENKCLVSMDEAKEVTATFDLEQHLLSVSKTGSGTGKVSSTPPGIDCGSDCDELYDHGTVVTLSASPDPGSEFTGFSGACTGTGTCEVTMSSAKSVTANFDEESTTPKFLLSVDVEGTGSGTVTSDKGLISCDPVCSDEYPEGTVVVLTATPDPGSVFMSWKYCDKGGVEGRKCTMTVDKAKQVKAVFTTTHALEVSRAGSGLGKVQSSPGGVLCLSNCSETAAAFKEGTKVLVKQTPAKHFHFVKWLGDCTGSGACEVTMGEDHEVQAEFAEDAKHLLTLTKSGGGQGTVKSSVAGINCGVTCSTMASAYYQGELVELTVTPGKGSTFGGWSGSGCTGTGTCTVTMSEAKAVQAEFK